MLKIFYTCLLFAVACAAKGQVSIPETWKQRGVLKALAAKDIAASRWSIGGETLDRGYADYQAYKSYLGPLGAKRIRLQAGWARCEKTKGRYDFAWLDSIVNDALVQQVQPWLQASYGNPEYAGGGDAALAGGLPTSPEALAAWDRWVGALVAHFKDRVHEWEIWNEPDLSQKFSALDYAAFYVRTGDIIRNQQPGARLIALALCCSGWAQYATTFVDHLRAVNRLGLIDVVSLHGYKYRPEDTYPNVAELKKVILAAKPGASFWQGENGAPSVKKNEGVGALREYDWSELTQAKWNLRRMFGDMGAALEVTNVFQISDMYYGSGDHMTGYNAKGLLKTRPDKSIERPKTAYYAFQHAASVFTGTFTPVPDALPEAVPGLSAFAYTNTRGAYLTLWMSSQAPAEDNAQSRKISLALPSMQFRQPVYIDLITGRVYDIPPGRFTREPSGCSFTDLPVPDYPVVIAERAAIITR